jgi:hypothetical protein
MKAAISPSCDRPCLPGDVLASGKVASPLDRHTLKVLDAARMLADGDKWQRLYSGVISLRK